MTSGPVAALRRAGRALGIAFGEQERQSDRAWSGEKHFLRLARSAFPGYRFHTVFDVGAHVGAISARFRACFPDAVLHAFEPAPETFATLSKALGGQSGVILNEIALSDEAGEVAFSAKGTRTVNHILAPSERETAAVIRIRAETGDSYCARAGVTSISFLKIDSEGHDLKVLMGFSRLLQDQAIDFVQVEAGMHPENMRHVPFEQLKSHMEASGYRLLRIYGQSGEPRLRILRRSDLVFVSLKMAEAYRRVDAPKA